MKRMLRTRLALGLIMASLTLVNAGVSGALSPAYGQTQPELKRLSPQFVTEQGCPVQVMAANTELEMDPFGVPMAARHYIDYKNVSGQPVAAVKFRIGYVNEQGNMILPYLNAPDAHPLGPGEQASQKWRGDRIDPKTREVKIRVLMVKMGDGSLWESTKASQGQTNSTANNGFVPLTDEGSGADIASGDVPRVPGTPVPFTEVGKNYTNFPDKTTTGPVNFRQMQTPPAGFEQNAFNGGPVPTTAPTTPPGFAPFADTPAATAPATAAPQASGAPWSATPGASAAPAAGPGPAASPAWTAPATTPSAVGAPVTPAWTPVPSGTPVAAPAAAAAAPAAPVVTDPLAEFDKLMGNKAKPAAAPAAAPAAVAPAATAPAAAAPAATAPAATAPAATAPAATAPGSGAPATSIQSTPIEPTPAPQSAQPAPADAPAVAPAATPPGSADDFGP